MPRVLAIDYGRKRTGLAHTDPMQIIATPLETIPTHTLIDYLRRYLQQNEVEMVVVGLPKQMNNEASESMTYLQPFIKEFKRVFPDVPITMYDERFTSVLAHRAMIDGGMRKKQRQDKAVVDKLAACIILEDYIESKRI